MKGRACPIRDGSAFGWWLSGIHSFWKGHWGGGGAGFLVVRRKNISVPPPPVRRKDDSKYTDDLSPMVFSGIKMNDRSL